MAENKKILIIKIIKEMRKTSGIILTGKRLEELVLFGFQ